MPNEKVSSLKPADRMHYRSIRPGGFGGPRHPGMFGPKVRAKNARETLKRLWQYLGRYKVQLIAVFMIVFISSVLGLVGPFLIGRIIDNYIIPGDFPGLARNSILLVLIYVAGSVAVWIQNYVMVGVSQNTIRDIRKNLFGRLQVLPLKFFDSHSHGELMSRLTNDIDNINQTLSMSITQVFSSAITIVGTLVAMLLLNPLLTLLSLIIVPIMMFCTGRIAASTRRFFTSQQEKLGDLNSLIEETISGQRTVKAFCRERESIEDFADRNTQLKDVGIRAQIFAGVIPPLMNVFNNLNLAVIAAAGGWMALNGMATVGVIASFLNYSRQFSRPLNELANQFNMVQSAIAGAERVFEVIDQPPETEDSPDAKSLDKVAGEVVFSNVTFGYKKELPVLKNISIHAKPGQTIALVGPTGAGKTTVVNLLTRFYDIDSGAIYIDGNDIRTIKRNSLRSSLGIVLQDTHLFSGTVRDNIRYGRLDASDAEVEAAARLANAEPFILHLPEGYDTVLSEDGGNLSQGQRQLISIARAILADPPILILDEATSNVDTRTEVHIQQAMLKLMRGRTSFVIAHRLSTIRDADFILVINNGEIVEQGTHKQLLDAEGFYYDLYTSQFDPEEGETEKRVLKTAAHGI